MPRSWAFDVGRAGLAHGAFFLDFSATQRATQRLAFGTLALDRSSFREAMVTTASGCTAGAAFRCVSLPLKLYMDFRLESHNPAATWRRLPLRGKVGICTQGLGTSLAFTMPVTGVAFLLYEASFLYL
jgi:hypothetical protein